MHSLSSQKCSGLDRAAWQCPSRVGALLCRSRPVVSQAASNAHNSSRTAADASTAHRPLSLAAALTAAATAAAAAAAPPALAATDAGMAVYALTQQLDDLVQQQLTGLTPASFGIVLFAGLLTSLSPCTLSVLPLTIGYIGGYAPTSSSSRTSSNAEAPSPSKEGAEVASGGDGTSTSSSSGGGGAAAPPQQVAAAPPRPPPLALQALSFSLGLASSLAALGVASSLAGRAYGTVLGEAAPLTVAVVAILMGLNLLEVLPLRLPSLDVDVRRPSLPPALQAYLAGATFALAASPCSTPILATLLAYVSASGDPLRGGGLLLAYSVGYVAPLLVAASATGAAKQVLSLRQYSAWVTPASGVLLVGGGTYALLSRLV